MVYGKNQIKKWGEVVGGGSEEDEVVSGGDGQDGEAAGEERGVATEEKVVEG